jgi:16S rRNA (cytosine967-C5)-methyltransferase
MPAARAHVSVAREIAAEVLLRVERDQAYANAALQAALENRPGLAARDVALASELVLGTLRRQLWLDHIVEAAADRPAARLELLVRVSLRLAAYQLLCMDRVPAHAAVHEAVELMKIHGLSRAAGFVNAVLRRIQRGPPPAPPADPLERLSIEESHPLWLVRRWAQRFGLDEARRLCAANNAPAPLTLRVNRLQCTPEELEARVRRERPAAKLERGRYSPVALRISGAGAVTQLPGQDEGLFQVQDEAAQLVGFWVGVDEARGGPVVDVCAAPGGKACHLAELGAKPVIALDLSARKLERVAGEARRLGKLPIRCVAADARAPLPLARGSQASILVDAPCSGLGTLRRHPELRYRRLPEDPARLAALQWEILSSSLDALAPGGRLTYAVCSGEPEEGSAQLTRLLAEHPDLAADMPPAEGWAQSRFGEAELVDQAGALSTWPHRHGLDGFYAFRVRRTA